MNRPSLSRSTLVPVAGAALTAILAGGVVWTATGSTAVLSLDGQSQKVDYRGSTAGEVVEAAGLTVGEHDRLVPSADTEVEDGETVSLRRGRELTLVVDGEERSVWVTASSVEEALQQVGLREDGLALSASRSRGIGLEGLTLAVTTPKSISIVADGKTIRTDSTRPTVQAALVEAGIALDADDRLLLDRAVPLTDGLVITVVRMRTDRTAERFGVPFTTVRKNDASLARGTTKVVTAGKAGVSERVVATTFADGKVDKRVVVSTAVVTRPVAKVVAVGTRAPAPAPAPAPARQQVASSSGPRQSTGGADSLNWAALAQCESGGNPRAVNPTGTYRGLYQFSLQTWRGVGGQGDPIDNSSGEQTYRAKLLYARSGAGQWPECGSRLFS